MYNKTRLKAGFVTNESSFYFTASLRPLAARNFGTRIA